MKIAFVYDRVNKFGGAERVLLALHKIFPDAPLYTLVYDKDAAPWAKVFKVTPTFINSLPFAKKHHEWLAPFAPMAFESLDLSQYDVVISITSSDAKAVITKPSTLHICYCLTPTRYFWSGSDEYGKDRKMKLIPNWLREYFRTVDLLTSIRPDEYIAISNEVKQRILKYYGREASVIYPAIDDKFYSKKTPVPMEDRKYFLIVSRLVPYKKVDLAIDTFNELRLPLKIVGVGSECSSLKERAGDNIEFLGAIDDDRLIELYRHAKAVIFPQEEDYGLVPIEAQATGTPVIAYGKGGALETVLENITGMFFDSQTKESLIRAIRHFTKLKIDANKCISNAKNFSSTKFAKEFHQSVLESYRNFTK